MTARRRAWEGGHAIVAGDPASPTLPAAGIAMPTLAGAALPDGATRPRVAVMQDGARLHYALPLALQRTGLLEAMFTDWFVTPGSRSAVIAALLGQVAPELGQRLSGRRCPELDPERIASNARIALKVWLTRLRGAAPEAREARLAGWMADWVGRRGWGEANCLMGFVRNTDPRLCEAAQSAGLVTIVDQMIAPAEIEYATLLRQAERWPDWVDGAGPIRPGTVIELEQRTWRAADHITCPSAYVRAGLLQQGLEPERVSEVAYPIDADAWEAVDRSGRTGPVIVGFVGAVGLRKGAPIVFELARLFDPARVRFVMVGPLGAPPRVMASAGSLTLIGAVPRSAVRAHLRAFDVFLLPSACEGSAGAVMEAMASALPVVTTPSSGTPVRDGVEGFVREVDDLEGLASCLGWLTEDSELRRHMGLAARWRAEEFSVDRYGCCVGLLLQSLMRDRHGSTRGPQDGR